MMKNNKKMMERRTLLTTTTKESVSSSEQEEEQEFTKSVLVFIGYNETTGDPMYIEPCVSNDNPNPYESNCTHVPTASPTTTDEKWGYNGEGNGKENYPIGEDVGRPGWSNSAGGEGEEEVWYEYECVDEYCNVHPPGSSSSSYGSGGSSSGGSSQESWTYIDTCLPTSTCPPPYDQSLADTDQYKIGNVTSISSNTLNSNVVTSLICPATTTTASGGDEEETSTSTEEEVVVPYVYTVESTSDVNSAYIFLPRLEEQILFNLANNMMSCSLLEDNDGGVNNNNENVRRRRRHRNLVVTKKKNVVMNVRRRRLTDTDEGAELFSVGGILSVPDDVPVDGKFCLFLTSSFVCVRDRVYTASLD